uniref:Uncharacterized protein n=1 Tax=Spiroplasma citri TaxID=2133 RepID=Q14P72_SPICI|nr:hypothetical protein SPICI03_242 [Spiroplasma citri]
MQLIKILKEIITLFYNICAFLWTKQEINKVLSSVIIKDGQLLKTKTYTDSNTIVKLKLQMI